MSDRSRNWWGWGWAEEALGDDEVAGLAQMVRERFADRDFSVIPAPDIAEVGLAPPRVDVPAALSGLVRTDDEDRARHTYGRAYRDVVRAVGGEFAHPPEMVIRPGDEADVVSVLDWAAEAGVKVVPYGGGSSVVGGVGATIEDAPDGWVSLDLTEMDRVLEIDEVSGAALIQGGALGPGIEAQLKAHGQTLRFFPQSFEFSTLGGWLATRAGGHFATGPTHIDDLVESMRVVTPAGVSESRRLPGSGAGPSHDRAFLGSEGALGVITEGWMKIRPRVGWKTSAGVEFTTWNDGVAAARELARSHLQPSNCRLLDAGEAQLSLGVEVGALLVLGFESAGEPLEAWMQQALELCFEHGGAAPGGVTTSSPTRDEEPVGDAGSVEAWRSAFMRAPYLRDGLIRCGVLIETFETACVWSDFDELHTQVTNDVLSALRGIVGDGQISCRFTHLYPDGPAPYFTVMAPTRRGSEVAIWDEVKTAASEAIGRSGGTITHHHAVGRDHHRWAQTQRSEVQRQMLSATKERLDPDALLNPGVLVDRA